MSRKRKIRTSDTNVDVFANQDRLFEIYRNKTQGFFEMLNETKLTIKNKRLFCARSSVKLKLKSIIDSTV